MYLTHFRFKHRPFRSVLNGAWYPAPGHELALRRLLQAVEDGEALVLVTGDPGTGKTLLCRRLFEKLGDEANQIYLTNSRFADCTSFLQAILYDISRAYEGKREQ